MPRPTVTYARRRTLITRLSETLRVFGILGWTAFGGTTANIVLLRRTFVQKEQWVDDDTFNDLLALGSALPGPSFIQLAFSISALRGGTLAAMLSFVLLTAPGAIMMTGIGFAIKKIPNTLPDIVFALLTGLNAAAVGLVALAAYELSKKVAVDRITRVILFLSAGIASIVEAPWLYPVLMVASGATTFLADSIERYRILRRSRQAAKTTSQVSEVSQQVSSPYEDDIEVQVTRPQPVAHRSSSVTITAPTENSPLLLRNNTYGTVTLNRYPGQPAEDGRVRNDSEPEPKESYFDLSIRSGLIIAASFFSVLITMLVVRGVATTNRTMKFATNLMLAGTVIFGGGPVVIPLLRGYTVDPGWVTPRDFLLLFALLQALPGPQFNLSAGLGVLVVTQAPIGGALLGIFCIFLPGIALKLAFLPLYQRWKQARHVRSILRGLNAGAVGLIYSAVYHLFKVGYISADPTGETAALSRSLDQDGFFVTIIGGTFLGCGAPFEVPAPLAILGGALAGIAWYGVRQA